MLRQKAIMIPRNVKVFLINIRIHKGWQIQLDPANKYTSLSSGERHVMVSLPRSPHRGCGFLLLRVCAHLAYLQSGIGVGDAHFFYDVLQNAKAGHTCNQEELDFDDIDIPVPVSILLRYMHVLQFSTKSLRNALKSSSSVAAFFALASGFTLATSGRPCWPQKSGAPSSFYHLYFTTQPLHLHFQLAMTTWRGTKYLASSGRRWRQLSHQEWTTTSWLGSWSPSFATLPTPSAPPSS